MQLPAGAYVLKLDASLHDALEPARIHLALEGTDAELPQVELTDASRGKWTTLETRFRLAEPATAETALSLSIIGADIPAGAGDFYLDNIVIERADPA